MPVEIGLPGAKNILSKAFHYNAPQQVLSISDSVFSLIRTSVDGKENILCITNITAKDQNIRFDTNEVGLKDKSWHDIMTGKLFKSPNGILSLNLKPYYVLWLRTS